MATRDEVSAALLAMMKQVAEAHGQDEIRSASLARLAEAWAWMIDPSQPHGGGRAK